MLAMEVTKVNDGLLSIDNKEKQEKYLKKKSKSYINKEKKRSVIKLKTNPWLLKVKSLIKSFYCSTTINSFNIF